MGIGCLKIGCSAYAEASATAVFWLLVPSVNQGHPDGLKKIDYFGWF